MDHTGRRVFYVDATLRYEIGTGNYVDYGEVGSLAR